ncbi:peptidylprolyl isomerase [Jeotgalibacillus soli]|uniref:Peptidyl-prolyl cis-trans isomerase n=1 Tax=Jeotgalibacillus soli TaxID=889306 RepID=A0A0C2VDG5_9BACL|nr:peptidylprolyl isomerase [Jeotgalibacillus soli]KIL42591.1 peptidyl-prolyl cis-trans isomerase [Jeotgalibacillus soli]
MKIRLLSVVFFFILLLTACGTSDNSSIPDLSSNETEEQNDTTDETQNDEVNSTESEGENTAMYPQLTTEVRENEALVSMNTNMGAIKIKLFPEYAPKTVENFLTHSKNGYYDGLKFHRVIKDFMLQGGDPTGTGMGGESIYGSSFEDEFSQELFNLRGALSMANSGPNTNGSQFFIVQSNDIDPGFKGQMEEAGFPAEIVEAYMKNGGTPWLDSKHTVFGQVIEGMEIVDEIAAVETGANDMPIEDVIIESVDVIQE